MRRRSETAKAAAATSTTTEGCNRCPLCSAPQWKVPGSGWGCENGHGFGEPSGPPENAALTPYKIAFDCIVRHGVDVMTVDGGCKVDEPRRLAFEIEPLIEGCKHERIIPYGDGTFGKCKRCGDASFPIRDPEADPEAPDAGELDAGDAITVTTGAEHYAPIRYHGFDCGPFAITVHVRRGETPHDAVARARTVLAELMNTDFESKVKDHLARIRQAAKYGLESGIVVK